MGEPPNIGPDTKIDFSEWHPLDHWPGSRRCRLFYGGVRNHLHLTWEYHRRDQLLKPIHKIKCRYGRHNIIRMWTRYPIAHIHEPGKPIRVTKWSEWKDHFICDWCGKPFDDETGENFATF